VAPFQYPSGRAGKFVSVIVPVELYTPPSLPRAGSAVSVRPTTRRRDRRMREIQRRIWPPRLNHHLAIEEHLICAVAKIPRHRRLVNIPTRLVHELAGIASAPLTVTDSPL